VHYKNSNDIEVSITERIKRLLHSDTVDVVPLDDLDAQLGTPALEPKIIEQTTEEDKEEDNAA
jgi:hypothetical protein